MKRILAVFLTLAMALNIAPMAAFAAADSDAASIVAVEETDETSSPQLDEETAKAIASDPFLQAAYAQTEQEQTGQAEVDTSNVSVNATNSFGQLLVNGIEGQSTDADGSTNRITKVTMNGRTANVQFVLDGTADLMVAIYTDSTEEEMVASGTTEVSGSADNGAAQVSIVGDIPETYTIKAFLLDKTDHSPLSSAYTDVSHTQVIVDLDKATVDDFEEDRVINLDENTDTNFVVVKQEVVLVSYADADGKNQLLSEDDAGLVYTFGNASDEIRNLKKGEVLTYEYAQGELLVARVQDISISGDTVTIYGDDTLDVTDVFDALKIDQEAEQDQFEYDETTASEDVKYLGMAAIDTGSIEETNGDMNDHGELKIGHEFTFYSNKGGETGEGALFEGEISGKVKLGVTGKVDIRITGGQKAVTYSMDAALTGSISVSGKMNYVAKLGTLGISPIPGLYVGFDPEVKFIPQITGTFELSVSDSIGTKFINDVATDCSKAPEVKMKAEVKGEIYFGLNLAPNIKVVGKVMQLKLDTEIGTEATIGYTPFTASTNTDSIHACSKCFEISMSTSFKLGISITFLFFKENSKEFLELVGGPFEFYWAPEYNDIGAGSCPHRKYRVRIDTELNNPAGTIIFDNTVAEITAGNDLRKLGTLGTDGVITAYLDPGWHMLTAVTADDQIYGSQGFYLGENPVDFTIVEGTNNDAPIVKPPKPTDPEPDVPDENPDYKLFLLTLTIYNQNILGDYPSVEDTPWYDDRDKVDQIELKEGVTTIGAFSFAQTAVRSVQMRSKVTDIGESAFTGCEKLEHVTFPGTMEEWKQVNIAEGNNALKKATIHCTDGDIKGNSGDSGEEEGKIIASGSCGAQGNNVWWKLYETGHLVIGGTGEMKNYQYGETPWHEVRKSILKVTIQDGVTSVGNYAFVYCSSLTSITLPESVTSIGNHAFDGYNSLTSITLPESLTSIGDGAFSFCGLTSITLPENLTSIGKKVFYACSSLTSITIPEKVTSIKEYTFYDCSNLTSITLPENLTSIKECAFYDCSNLTSITLPENLTSIGKQAFDSCIRLTSITLPESLTSIGDRAFSECGLTSITIPESVTSIEDYVFEYCRSLTSITLPENLTSIGKDVFYGCSSLTSITLPKGLTRIEMDTFYGSGLTSITIPENVTSIEYRAFESCSSLMSITLPENLTSIKEFAFYHCIRLENVYYSGTKDEWNSISIDSGGNYPLSVATIHCTDGDIVPNTENSITTGTASTSDSKFQAAFADAKAGKEYVVLVSRSGSDPLNADNLIYINQITADADGELAVPFITAADAAEMTYVVACAQGDATVDPDQPVDPGQPDQPGGDKPGEDKPGGDKPGEDKPGGDQPSSDDGGGAAIILIGGVAAVAAVAGVALMMPVKVEGTVKLADQPVANATVQVLKNGNVAAQTVTDANGHFTVKVKRGGYTLRVQWTDASGQPVTRTVDFKAPNANLNVAA